MITAKEALEIYRKEFPKDVVASVEAIDDFYSFNLIPPFELRGAAAFVSKEDGRLSYFGPSDPMTEKKGIIVLRP